MRERIYDNRRKEMVEEVLGSKGVKTKVRQYNKRNGRKDECWGWEGGRFKGKERESKWV